MILRKNVLFVCRCPTNTFQLFGFLIDFQETSYEHFQIPSVRNNDIANGRIYEAGTMIDIDACSWILK
jgi:hypothetical protein